jgi:hypothetical protein
VLFEVTPDLVLKFAILCRGQPSYDLEDSARRVDLCSPPQTEHYKSTDLWYADLRAELLTFPAGKHDDQVDALGLVGQLLDQMASGPVLKQKIDALNRAQI